MKIEYLEELLDRDVMQGSFSEGERFVLACYENTFMRYFVGKDVLVIDEMIWERDFEEVLRILKLAEVKEIIYTNNASGSLDFIHYLVKEGCIVEEAVEIVMDSVFEREKTVKGLRIKINF